MRGGHERILRGRYTRFVQENLGALEGPSFKVIVRADRDLCPELLERQEMAIEATAPDDVASWWRQRDVSEAGKQRPGEEDGSPQPRAEVRIEPLRDELRWVDAKGLIVDPLGSHPELFENGDE
jgi:hypothetical protein